MAAGHVTKILLSGPAPGPVVQNPCVPSPCGPYAECRDIGGAPSCSCLASYIGSPPNCRPECTVNSDCPRSQACMNERCRDPCPGSCGLSATCSVINHTPACVCPDGFTGDPFTNCYLKRKQCLEIRWNNACASDCELSVAKLMEN